MNTIVPVVALPDNVTVGVPEPKLKPPENDALTNDEFAGTGMR